MSNEIPGDLHFLESHEWVRINDDGTATVGISDHAQQALGDLVYVELPEVGSTVEKGEGKGVAVVESVKAASDIYSPLSGEVVAVNEALADAPETVNTDAYGEGWIFKVKLSDRSEIDGLLSADDYAHKVENEDH